MADILAKLVFVALVIAWYFYMQRVVFRFLGRIDIGKLGLFEKVWSYAFAAPLTAASVLAAFGALAVARWVFT